jgi:hypothetical protein
MLTGKHREASMHIYKFRKAVGSQCALTSGSTGAVLPNDGNPWIYEKTVDLDADDEPRIGASSLEIMAGIEAAGYFLWPTDEIKDA